MDRIEYIPLGSIVLLKGGIQKMLVISRALNVQKDGNPYFFDYGAVPYPEGLISDQMAYFNHDQLAKIVFEGFKDEDNEVIVQNIYDYLDKHPDIVRGSIEIWQK